jgi:hypothetical protein
MVPRSRRRRWHTKIRIISRRVLVPLILLVAALVPASALAAAYAYDIPELVDKPLAAVKKATDIPVLLPSRLTSEHRRLYSEGKGRANRYEFTIGATRRCGTSTACYVAGFRGRRGGKPAKGRKVALAKRLTGSFQRSRCGASCGPASLEWVQDGVLYEVEGKLGTQRTERSVLTRLANSAIRNGPR